MIALLLNSGRGTRMGDETKEHPKCLCRLDGEDTIISWQVKLLAKCGVKEAVVTTGPFEDMLREHLESLNSGITFHYVPNPDYAATNYIYSMYLAREALAGEDVISLHGDLVMAPEVMARLVAQERSSVVIDTTLPLPEKDFKAQLTGDRVKAVGIHFFGDDCAASQPAYLFREKDFRRWMEEISAFCERGERSCYAENAFNAACEEIDLHAMDVQGLLCAEIDNPEDHARVCEAFRKQVKEA